MPKNNSYYASALQAARQPMISAKIDRLVNSPKTHIKAFASVNIGGWYAIHGLRVIDSQKGLFVQMPQNTINKDGKLTYQDVFHPVTSEARSELFSKVLEAYNQKLTEEAAQTAAPQQGNYPELKGFDPDDPFADLGNNQGSDLPPFDMSM